MNWLQALTLIASNFAFILTLWLWHRSESRHDHARLESLCFTMLNGIKEEMKDFHGRLERQDAEFKGRLEKQDAEFKSGFLRLEEKIRLENRYRDLPPD